MSPTSPHLACNLTVFPPDERERLVAAAKQLLVRAVEARVDPHQIALRFGGAKDERAHLRELADFIAHDRRCCPFLRHGIACDPRQGAVWLTLAGTGEVLTDLITELRRHVPPAVWPQARGCVRATNRDL
ncbi:MAG: hypothetical protein B7733_02110 [Myxococcales bacterium FL481]|nr:MAG: hypothetical protein B7733_02110 [Myxococcales bacterium FL481]